VQGRYVIVYTGAAGEGAIALDDVQVYTYGEHGAHSAQHSMHSTTSKVGSQQLQAAQCAA
jgi:hypothetical protein